MIWIKSGKRPPTSCCLILALILAFILLVSYLEMVDHLVEVRAQSPSFVRQEILDDTHNDWRLWQGSSSSRAANVTTHSGIVSELPTVQDISECKTFGGSRTLFSPDIESVSYISDGNTLNATVWLTDPFEEPLLTDKLDTFQENLVLRVSQTNFTLEDYTDVKRGQVIDPLVQSAIEENSTSLSGYPAHEIVHSSNTGSDKLKIMQVWTIKNGNAYEFTYSALDDEYLEFLPIIRQIIDSFTIANNVTAKDVDIKSLSLTSSNQSNNQLQDFSVYKRNGIVVDYPKDWVVIDENQNSGEGIRVVFRSPFEDEILNEPSWREITYTMAVDIDSVHDAGTDYRIKVLRTHDENWNWNWSRQVQEVSAYDRIRVLHEDKNYTSFSRNGEPFILFSFDLNSVNAPSQYKAVFYITDYYVINHHLCRLIDTTNWVIIPPPDFEISVEPSSSIVLRPNDEKTVQLQIKGDSDLQSEAALMTTSTNTDNSTSQSIDSNTEGVRNELQYGNKDIDLEFTPNVIPVPPSGIGTSTLYIKVAENATAKPHTFPVLANISFPTSIINRGGEIFNNSRSVNVMESANLTITVLPPYTFEEQMNNFVEMWITPISGVWSFVAGVGAVVAPLLLFFYRRKQKQQKSIT